MSQNKHAYTLATLMLVLLIYTGCAPRGIPQSIKTKLPQDIQELIAIRSMSKTEIEQKVFGDHDLTRYHVPIFQLSDTGDVIYDETTSLDYYFLNEKLVMLVQLNHSNEFDSTADSYIKLREILGEEEARLHGDNGPLSVELVYAKYGIVIGMTAWASTYKKLKFIKPMSLRKYQKKLYQEPTYLREPVWD